MTTSYRPVVRTQSDLHDVWRFLMGPHASTGGFAGCSVWLLVIDADDRPIPQITEITGATDPPDDEMVASLATVLGELAEPGRRFALLRSRPGPGGLTADDKAWARSLYDVGRRAGVPFEVVHRACDEDLVAVPMDEVMGLA